MIRVAKSEIVPQSLLNTSSYNGDDVQQQLLQDQHKKCYICECEVEPNFHIEHLNSRAANRQDWDNLFLSCGYCNERKLRLFDSILNPVSNNIEEIIEQRLDRKKKTAIFKSQSIQIGVAETIQLLERLYNTKSSNPKLRGPHERLFWNNVERNINDFLRKVNDYGVNKSDEKKISVQEELSIDKPFLGFKYWIIKDKPELLAVFGNDIKWNKQ